MYGNSLFFCVFEMIIQENRGEVLELESIIQRHIFRSRSLSHQSNCSSISDTEEDSCPCQNYRYVLYCTYSLFRNSMAWFQKKIWFRYLSSEIGTNVLVQLQNNFIDLYYLKIWAQNFRQNLKKGHNLLWNTLWTGN